MSLKFHLNGPRNNDTALVQIMACTKHQAKPLSGMSYINYAYMRLSASVS